MRYSSSVQNRADYDLAIVLPAFKARFLKETMDALTNQTDKRFALYVSDDASPHDLISIVEPYGKELQMKYHRFPDNLGGRDLVAHWRRSIDLTAGEPWIWLLSDDDIPSSNAVAAFYEALQRTAGAYDIYRFPVSWIGADSKPCGPGYEFNHPQFESAYDFTLRRLSGEAYTCAQDHIFRRSIYERKGFVAFDLAWHSDTATYISFAMEKGFYTISQGRLWFRQSGLNISSRQEREILIRKLKAELAFLDWVQSAFLEFPVGQTRQIARYAGVAAIVSVVRSKLSPLTKIYRSVAIFPHIPINAWFWVCAQIFSKALAAIERRLVGHD